MRDYPEPPLSAPRAVRRTFVRADLQILRAIFPRGAALSRILGVTPGDLAAWDAGAVPAPELEVRLRVLTITVRDLAVALLPGAIPSWMEAPEVHSGLSPADLLRSGRYENLAFMVAETLQGDVYS